ncbi:bifunctional 4-hydroxy-2-oxoglutarate aldolase/2-dehydro-3-deoxy-phosphogluconate aldolase [Sporosarcina sp.]|uniref:bifunctional 4-hydroxy-2-oxoglutarate aldolase/2-dehydro-3-deoxy-phosphogluconate aldolase n=1 Tax=Sporosarcina sp. TaxID=49982 RepID=UPI002607649C|nr:bifunctional 4-hydroxy-2-oxoglutarate aldolase/2-dehydro-3-deoxy-phosphogluconate aldolase [Sporosarcina sp.]
MEKILVEIDNQKVLKQIEDYGIVPVVKIEDVKDALPLAKALIDGGLNLAEITFRTNCAADVIKEITKKYPDMLIGAGTINSVEQVKQAMSAGAKFIVCPALIDEVVDYCIQHNILVIPGCATASDVQKAVSYGLTNLKFFPAKSSGGIQTIKALCSVYKDVRFMPTGGIGLDNISEYVNDPNVIACGGSWMVNTELISSGKFDEIRKLTRDSIFKMLNFDFAHFGINCDTEEEGYKNIFKLADMFDLTLGDTESSTYVGKDVEITKQPFKVRGPHGHIGYHTDNLKRSIFYLGNAGVEFNTEHIKYHGDKMFVIYLKDYLAGFAIHIEERNDHNPSSWDHRDDIKSLIGWNK